MKKRQFWGHWRWLHERACSQCGRVHNILGNDTRLTPSLPPGAIKCECGGLVNLG